MSDFKAPWSWDDKVWEECDPMQRAPWLVDATGNPVLKGEIRCVSEELAHLIEAAPELLECLQATFDMIGERLLDDVFGYEWLAKAKAALAKAREETT
jgi:hypothetical protein